MRASRTCTPSYIENENKFRLYSVEFVGFCHFFSVSQFNWLLSAQDFVSFPLILILIFIQINNVVDTDGIEYACCYCCCWCSSVRPNRTDVIASPYFRSVNFRIVTSVKNNCPFYMEIKLYVYKWKRDKGAHSSPFESLNQTIEFRALHLEISFQFLFMNRLSICPVVWYSICQ